MERHRRILYSAIFDIGRCNLTSDIAILRRTPSACEISFRCERAVPLSLSLSLETMSGGRAHASVFRNYYFVISGKDRWKVMKQNEPLLSLSRERQGRGELFNFVIKFAAVVSRSAVTDWSPSPDQISKLNETQSRSPSARNTSCLIYFPNLRGERGQKGQFQRYPFEMLPTIYNAAPTLSQNSSRAL